MRNLFSFFIIFLIFSCGGTGLEGFVNEPITITALDPEDGQDYDYFWSVENQPDGSLINSSDLKTSNGGKEMIFLPDYPGDYTIELVISKYGDEIDVQKFLFTISDQIIKKDDSTSSDEEDGSDDWLDDEYEDDEYEDDEYEDDEYEDDEYENDENDGVEQSATLKNKKAILPSAFSSSEKVSKIKSIAEKTDRYTIQITSKKKLKDAQIFSKTLLKKGYDVYIQKIVLDDNETWYRIRLGSYNNYNAAKKDAKLISSELGFSVWVDFVRKEQK